MTHPNHACFRVRGIAATLERRNTPIATTVPPAQTEVFVEARGKQAQWAGWLRKARIGDTATALGDIIKEVRSFVGAMLTSLATGSPSGSWTPGAPWEEAAPHP